MTKSIEKSPGGVYSPSQLKSSPISRYSKRLVDYSDDDDDDEEFFIIDSESPTAKLSTQIRNEQSSVAKQKDSDCVIIPVHSKRKSSSNCASPTQHVRKLSSPSGNFKVSPLLTTSPSSPSMKTISTTHRPRGSIELSGTKEESDLVNVQPHCNSPKSEKFPQTIINKVLNLMKCSLQSPLLETRPNSSNIPNERHCSEMGNNSTTYNRPVYPVNKPDLIRNKFLATSCQDHQKFVRENDSAHFPSMSPSKDYTSRNLNTSSGHMIVSEEKLADNEYKLCKRCGFLSKLPVICEGCKNPLPFNAKTITRNNIKLPHSPHPPAFRTEQFYGRPAAAITKPRVTLTSLENRKRTLLSPVETVTISSDEDTDDKDSITVIDVVNSVSPASPKRQRLSESSAIVESRSRDECVDAKACQTDREHPMCVENEDNIPVFTGPVVKLFTYPPAPEKGGISITNEDLFCLSDRCYLNDIIIDFWLKYMHSMKLSDIEREKTYIFNSFFFKRLSQRTGQSLDLSESNISDVKQKRHHRVKNWTRHVDIFSKDFILVPINESAHWFLAIICFPSLSQEQSSRHSGCQNINRQSCIIVFDSLKGPSRSPIIKILRDYLQVEWEVKKSSKGKFTNETVVGIIPDVPQQENFSDCGLYVLQYAESFFEKPIKNYVNPFPSLELWFDQDVVRTKRETIRSVILQLKEQYPD